MHTDGSAQPNQEEMQSGLELETSSPADAMTGHETAGAEMASHEAAPDVSLTPFQEPEWELPAPVSGHDSTLNEAVHNAEEWREAWSAVDLPGNMPQTIGLLRGTIGSTLGLAMLHGTTAAADETEAPASQPDLMSELGHVRDGPRDLAGQILSGLENASPLRIRTDLRTPGPPFQLNRHTPPPPPRVHDLPSGEASGLSESPAIEHWPLLGEIAERTVRSEARTLSPFSVLEAAPHVSQLLTPQRNPVLGEILHRQESAVEALSLVAHRTADLPVVHMPDAMASGEPAGALAQYQPDELVSTFPVQFASLHRVANLANMALRTTNIEERASSLVDATLPEARGSEAVSMLGRAGPGNESQESIQPRHIAQASDRMLLNGITHAPEPIQDLIGPLDSVVPTFRSASLQILRQMAPMGAAMAIASLASLPGLGHSEPPADLMRPATDTHLRHDPAGEYANTSSVAESLQAAALTAGEQFVFPPSRMNLSSSQSLSLLGHEFVHTDHPLALRPLPEIANLLVDGAEQVAHPPEQVPHQSFAQELLPPPSMEVRREAHVATALAQAQSNGGFRGGQWSDQTSGQAVDQRVATTPHPAETPVAESLAGGGDSNGTVWQGATAGIGAGMAGAADLDSLARQVFALLQSQLRAERDRHQLYNR
jgi:hypothetical protein